ncbi:hypothetical protein [Bauldia sp.]
MGQTFNHGRLGQVVVGIIDGCGGVARRSISELNAKGLFQFE